MSLFLIGGMIAYAKGTLGWATFVFSANVRGALNTA